MTDTALRTSEIWINGSLLETLKSSDSTAAVKTLRIKLPEGISALPAIEVKIKGTSKSPVIKFWKYGRCVRMNKRVI
ncbi:hypothetical protein KUH03_40930 [Sphingobacterium sp. E70]|nr:hypothetical protein [Sphingobacterium sp. E70]ULT25141.1 hypothetical protein KUH03_40930 [Sphingobacterium sp. E70]